MPTYAFDVCIVGENGAREKKIATTLVRDRGKFARCEASVRCNDNSANVSPRNTRNDAENDEGSQLVKIAMGDDQAQLVTYG